MSPPRPPRIRRVGAALAAAVLLSSLLVSARATAAPPPLPSAAAAALQADLDALTTHGAIGAIGAVDSAAGSWSGASGARSIDGTTAAVATDRTRVGSLTKAMVATLAMQEVEYGRWTLDTTVGSVLPGLLPGHEDVTLEQLLAHRSGIPYVDQVPITPTMTGEQLRAALSANITARGQVERALASPWVFEPGTNWQYSNTGFIVVGLMLEQLNQKSVASLMASRIFGPAGMTSSRYTTTAGWGRSDHLSDYAVIERPYNLDATGDASAGFAASAVESTPADLNRFWRALLTGQLLKPELVKEMTRVRTPGTGYALGVIAFDDPCPGPNGTTQQLYGHDGAVFGIQSLAFTSADGTRQVSVSWSGRNVRQETLSQFGATYVYRAFILTCPAANTAARSRVQVQDRAKKWQAQLERLTTVSQSSARASRASTSGSSAR